MTFLRAEGTTPSLRVFASSRETKSDFTQRRKDAKKSPGL